MNTEIGMSLSKCQDSNTLELMQQNSELPLFINIKEEKPNQILKIILSQRILH